MAHGGLLLPVVGTSGNKYIWHAGQLFTLTACFGGKGHLLTNSSGHIEKLIQSVKLVIASCFSFFSPLKRSYPSPQILDACTEGVRWLTGCGYHFPQSRKASLDKVYHIRCAAVMLNDGNRQTCLHSALDRFITLFTSNINNTSMLLPHQPTAALAEQSLDNKASRLCTPDSFSIVALTQRMVLLRLLLHCSSVIPSSILWLGKTDWPLTGLYVQESCFPKTLPRHIAHDSYGIILPNPDCRGDCDSPGTERNSSQLPCSSAWRSYQIFPPTLKFWHTLLSQM